ncbi:MAG: ribosome recycling factor [Clostridia bacterium]|nr:ribosome recycling factor [Clostridia bacterium]
MAENNELIDEIFLEYEDALEKATTHLKSELLSIRAGRANPHVLDKITVDYYGTPTPLAHVSNITVTDARSIMISPWDQSLVKEINKAIVASDLGLSPSDDGRVVRLTFPILTEERRRDLVKSTKKLGEDTKIVCRNARRDALEELKKLKKDGIIGEDDLASYEKDIQKTLDNETVKIDNVLAEKEKEIMQV